MLTIAGGRYVGQTSKCLNRKLQQYENRSGKLTIPGNLSEHCSNCECSAEFHNRNGAVGKQEKKRNVDISSNMKPGKVRSTSRIFLQVMSVAANGLATTMTLDAHSPDQQKLVRIASDATILHVPSQPRGLAHICKHAAPGWAQTILATEFNKFLSLMQ